MQTSYAVNYQKAIEGMPVGKRDSRPGTIAMLAQILELTVAAGSATDDLVITVVDDETGQSYEATATGSANEATLAANAVAAVRASEIDKLFAIVATQATDTQDVILTLTARHTNRSYTLSATGGTGAASVAETQAPGGEGLEFGLMVAKGSADGSIRAPASGDGLRDLAGILFRTDANHLHQIPDADKDTAEAGSTRSVMYRGRLWVRPETAVDPNDSVHVRVVATTGERAGALRASADGGDTVDISTFAEWESSAGAGELAVLRLRM